MLEIRTILHPTDFSARSEYAFRLACSLARDHHARLVVLHVVQLPPTAYSEMYIDVPASPAYLESAEESLRNLLKSAAQVDCQPRVEEGDPATEIIRVARETNAELIVMGTHGRTGLSRLVMGSVAELVLRKAPCPVLTVKMPVGTAPTAAEDAAKVPATAR